MKFSRKNKIAILLLLGIGIAGFILGFISPRISLLNSEAAGWGKPQANIENKEIKIGIYDVLFVEYLPNHDVEWTEDEEDVTRITLKLLLNLSNPFEEINVRIPRIDIKLGHLDKPVGRVWTTEEFALDPFDVNPDTDGDTIEEQKKERLDHNAAGIWSIYLTLYTGADSGLNYFLNDLFAGNLGGIAFDATLELGNYPLNVEGIFGELLKLVGLGLGGTETGAITDEPVPEMLAGALGADLDRIKPAVRSNTIFFKETKFSNTENNKEYRDIRTLTEDLNVTLFSNEVSATLLEITSTAVNITDEIIYFGSTEEFQTLYIANASGSYQAKHDNSTGVWTNKNITYTKKDPIHGNCANGDGEYIWEYWDGTDWVSFNQKIQNDTSSNFGYNSSSSGPDQFNEDWQDGYMNWIQLDDWAATTVSDSFTKDYFFVRVRTGGKNFDSGLNAPLDKVIRADILHSRIGNAEMPTEAPEDERSTVFNDGGLQLEQSIMAEEEIIVYPGIKPEELPDDDQAGILRYGEGEFDEYLEDIILSGGDLLSDVVVPYLLAPDEGGIYNALILLSSQPELVFFDGDIDPGPNQDPARVFFNLFKSLYTHNISTSDFLIKCQLDLGAILDDIIGKMAVNSPYEFTHESMWGDNATLMIWEDSSWADSDEIFVWTENSTFQDATSYSWYLFGILAAVTILSVPYNLKNKQDQTKFLSGSDISNAKDLMEDDTGKTVLIGSVSSAEQHKVRYELLGGFAAVGIGVLLFILKELAFADFNDAGIYSFLPEIFQSLFENSRNIDFSFESEEMNNNNPYWPMVMLLTAFIDFPGIFAWLIPSIYVSYKRNTQFTNIKKRRVGWDVFWKGAYLIELLMAIMAIGLVLATFLPMLDNQQDLISYFAGGLIFIVFLFITPYFYFAIGIAGLGGFIGSRLALSQPGESEVTFTEEYLAEGDEYAGTADYDEYAEYEEDEYEEFEDTDRTEIVDFDSQGEVVGMVCKYCWETYPVGTDSCGKCGNTDVTQAIECPNCGNMIPIDAKFCNECGAQM